LSDALVGAAHSDVMDDLEKIAHEIDPQPNDAKG